MVQLKKNQKNKAIIFGSNGQIRDWVEFDTLIYRFSGSVFLGSGRENCVQNSKFSSGFGSDFRVVSVFAGSNYHAYFGCHVEHHDFR